MVGERRPQDLGDLTGLMKSLHEVGLIHPIVVTDDLILVAGARRLEATKRLGLTLIEVRRVGELTRQERNIIELEENLHRKKLTPIERSQTTVSLVGAVGAQLREQAQTHAAQGTTPTHDADVSTPSRASPEPDGKQSKFDNVPTNGRPHEEKPDSQAQVAAEIGMSQSQVSDAQRHVEAVERYPELGASDLSRAEALRQCRAWDDMKPWNRTRARKTWNAQ